MILAFILFAVSDVRAVEIDKAKIYSSRTLLLILITFIACALFVAFLVCISKVSKEMKLSLNYLRAQNRQLQALRAYRDANYLTIN